MNLQRLELLVGQDTLKQLKECKVIVFGVGGVGGWLCEMLVRCGIGELTVVDFDKVDETNINRQLIALSTTIGQTKVDLIKQRMQDINPEIKISALNKRLTNDNVKDFNCENYNFVVDCIDDLSAKFALIKYCYDNNIDIICAMGAGNRYASPHYEVVDIYKTSYDAIAKKLRKFCRDNDIKHLPVVATNAQPINTNSKTIGSVVYHPVASACALCSYIINKFMEDKQ